MLHRGGTQTEMAASLSQEDRYESSGRVKQLEFMEQKTKEEGAK